MRFRGQRRGRRGRGSHQKAEPMLKSSKDEADEVQREQSGEVPAQDPNSTTTTTAAGSRKSPRFTRKLSVDVVVGTPQVKVLNVSVPSVSKFTNTKVSKSSSVLRVQTCPKTVRMKREKSLLSCLASALLTSPTHPPHLKKERNPPLDSNAPSSVAKLNATTAISMIPGNKELDKLGSSVVNLESHLENEGNAKSSPKVMSVNKTGKKKRPVGRPKKRGIRKTAKSGDLLLRHMVQCYNMLKTSPSNSQRHIAQLLLQEIEGATGRKKSCSMQQATTNPSCSLEQEPAASGQNDESGTWRSDDHRNDDNQMSEDCSDPQVLEIEATFLFGKSSGENDCQQMKSVTLLPLRSQVLDKVDGNCGVTPESSGGAPAINSVQKVYSIQAGYQTHPPAVPVLGLSSPSTTRYTQSVVFTPPQGAQPVLTVPAPQDTQSGFFSPAAEDMQPVPHHSHHTLPSPPDSAHTNCHTLPMPSLPLLPNSDTPHCLPAYVPKGKREGNESSDCPSPTSNFENILQLPPCTDSPDDSKRMDDPHFLGVKVQPSVSVQQKQTLNSSAATEEILAQLEEGEEFCKMYSEGIVDDIESSDVNIPAVPFYQRCIVARGPNSQEVAVQDKKIGASSSSSSVAAPGITSTMVVKENLSEAVLQSRETTSPNRAIVVREEPFTTNSAGVSSTSPGPQAHTKDHSIDLSSLRDSAANVRIPAEDSTSGQLSSISGDSGPSTGVSFSRSQLHPRTTSPHLDECDWEAAVCDFSDSEYSNSEDILSIFASPSSPLGSEAEMDEADENPDGEAHTTIQHCEGVEQEHAPDLVEQSVVALTDEGEQGLVDNPGHITTPSPQMLNPEHIITPWPRMPRVEAAGDAPHGHPHTVIDSDDESIQSRSTVVRRIMEKDARDSLLDEVEDSNMVDLATTAVQGDTAVHNNKVESPIQISNDNQEESLHNYLLKYVDNEAMFQKDFPVASCVESHLIGLQDEAAFSPTVTESLENTAPPTPTRQGMELFESQETDKWTPGAASGAGVDRSSEKETPPKPQPCPAHQFQKNMSFRTPKPSLPKNMGFCFSFINNGVCNRTVCSYNHEINLETESYLGLLILHYVTNQVAFKAWRLLDAHLVGCRHSLPLAISLLLPLARHLVEHKNHNRPLSVQVPAPFTIPLDIATVRILCEAHQGLAAYKLFCSCYSTVPPEGLRILLNIFVRFCERCPEKQLLSPWEKVLFWEYEHQGSAAEAELKDLFGIEWLKVLMLDKNTDKVWEAYSHLSQALVSPSDFFTHITCSVISFSIDIGKPQQSFWVLKEVRRLQASSPLIFTALIPRHMENALALQRELKDLGELVCELVVPLPSTTWDLLLTHMINFDNLSLSIDLISIQMKFSSPKLETMEKLLLECIQSDPNLLQPLSNLVCSFSGEVLGPLHPILSQLVDRLTHASPQAQQTMNIITQHCLRFGINLRCRRQASQLLEGTSSSNSSRNLSEKLQANTQDLDFLNTRCPVSKVDRGCMAKKFGIKKDPLLGRSPNHSSIPSKPRYTKTPLLPNPEPLALQRLKQPLDDSRHCEALQSNTITPTSSACHIEQPPCMESEHEHPSSEHQAPLIIDYQHMSGDKKNIKCRGGSVRCTFGLENTHSTPQSRMKQQRGGAMWKDAREDWLKMQQPQSSNSFWSSSLVEPAIIPDHPHTQSPRVLGTVSHKTDTMMPTAGSSLKRNFDVNEFSSPRKLARVGATGNAAYLQEDRDIPQFRVVRKRHKLISSEFTASSIPRRDSTQIPVQESEPTSLPIPKTVFSELKVNSKCSEAHEPPKALKQISNVALKVTSFFRDNMGCSSQQGKRNHENQQIIVPQQSQAEFEENPFTGQPPQWSYSRSDSQLQRWWCSQVKAPGRKVLGAVSDCFSQSVPTSASPCSRSSTLSAPFSGSSVVSQSPGPHSFQVRAGSSENSEELVAGDDSRMDLSLSILVCGIVALEGREERVVRLVELFTTLTEGANIYTSGTQLGALLKTLTRGGGGLGEREREVVGALGVAVLSECIKRRVLSEAELVILHLHHYRLPFFTTLPVSSEDHHSEQQMAVMALRVLHLMGNFKLFISILEDMCWSGCTEDVRARLEVLSEVLESLIWVERSQGALLCTTRVLASLVTYYHHDRVTLSNEYWDFLDLSEQLERAWDWLQACRDLEMVEQLTVVLNTALHLGLPLSQELTCRIELESAQMRDFNKQMTLRDNRNSWSDKSFRKTTRKLQRPSFFRSSTFCG